MVRYILVFALTVVVGSVVVASPGDGGHGNGIIQGTKVDGKAIAPASVASTGAISGTTITGTTITGTSLCIDGSYDASLSSGFADGYLDVRTCDLASLGGMSLNEVFVYNEAETVNKIGLTAYSAIAGFAAVKLASDIGIRFCDGVNLDAGCTMDAGVRRSSAGVVAVDDGTGSGLGSLSTRSVTVTPVSGAACIYDELGATCSSRTDDANSNNRSINSSDVWPFAAAAKTAGSVIVRGGLDSKTWNVLDGLAGCSGADTVTCSRIINGVSTSNTGTYGTDFCSGVGDDTCANATEAAVRISVWAEALSGVGSSASGATCPSGAANARCVGVTADRFTSSITLTNNDDTCTVDSNGTDGQILLSGLGTESLPVLSNAADPDTGFRWLGSNGWAISAGGANAVYWAGTGLVSVNNITSNSGFIKALSGDLIATSGNVSFGGTSASNGQLTTLKQTTESISCAGGGGSASITTVTGVPDGAWFKGVTTRVTSAGLTGPTSMDIGVVGDVDLFANDAGVADNDTTDRGDATANWANPVLDAFQIIATFNGGNCTAGTVRFVMSYEDLTAPTSD